LRLPGTAGGAGGIRRLWVILDVSGVSLTRITQTVREASLQRPRARRVLRKNPPA